MTKGRRAGIYDIAAPTDAELKALLAQMLRDWQEPIAVCIERLGEIEAAARSRLDLAARGATPEEIRDASPPNSEGKWISEILQRVRSLRSDLELGATDEFARGLLQGLSLAELRRRHHIEGPLGPAINIGHRSQRQARKAQEASAAAARTARSRGREALLKVADEMRAADPNVRGAEIIRAYAEREGNAAVSDSTARRWLKGEGL